MSDSPDKRKRRKMPIVKLKKLQVLPNGSGSTKANQKKEESISLLDELTSEQEDFILNWHSKGKSINEIIELFTEEFEDDDAPSKETIEKLIDHSTLETVEEILAEVKSESTDEESEPSAMTSIIKELNVLFNHGSEFSLKEEQIELLGDWNEQGLSMMEILKRFFIKYADEEMIEKAEQTLRELEEIPDSKDNLEINDIVLKEEVEDIISSELGIEVNQLPLALQTDELMIKDEPIDEDITEVSHDTSNVISTDQIMSEISEPKEEKMSIDDLSTQQLMDELGIDDDILSQRDIGTSALTIPPNTQDPQ